MTYLPVGILLAAGLGSRFGQDKLMQPLPDSCPVAIRAAQHLLQILPVSVAVVNAHAPQLATRLDRLGYQVIVNDSPEHGLSRSLRLGIVHAATTVGWIVALGDMPWVSPASIRGVVDALSDGASLAAPEYHGHRGHPVGFAAHWRDSLVKLHGDSGAGKLIAANARQLVRLQVDDPGVIRDVDVPSDLDGPVEQPG